MSLRKNVIGAESYKRILRDLSEGSTLMEAVGREDLDASVFLRYLLGTDRAKEQENEYAKTIGKRR